MRSKELMIWLYGWFLHWFPGNFRREFEEEMIDVVRQAAGEAWAQGRLQWLAFWLRELSALPVCLAREHWLTFSQPAANLSPQAELQAAGQSAQLPGRPTAPLTPAHLFLAALPHLLVGFFFSLGEAGLLSNLLPEGSPLAGPLAVALWLGLGGGLLWALVSAWRARWPGWSGTWLAYFGLAGFGGLIALIQAVDALDWLNTFNVSDFLVAGVVAFGLYYVTRRNAMHGLLAGMTVVAVTGIIALEFVPPGLRGGVTAFAWVTLAVFSMLALKAGSLSRALPLALLGSMLLLTPFAWVGIYHGGMLYFDAPGPSWLQVARTALPFYGLAGCLLLGPQLARRLRLLSMERDVPSVWRYRLALLGELVMLAGAVTFFWQRTSNSVPNTAAMEAGLLSGGFIMLCAGFALVVWEHERLPGSAWAAALALGLAGLPWALLASLPSLAGAGQPFPLALKYYPEFVLHLSALAWAGLSLWVILAGEKYLLRKS